MTKARAYLLASRPATLSAAVVPVLVGSAAAYRLGHFRTLPAIAALVGAILIQLGTNYANDVFDYEKGADTHDRLGPLRVTQAGLLSPKEVKTAMALAFFAAALTGVYLIVQGGLPILVLGILSILSGIAYTGGPYPLGYHGLGDLFVMIFFGFVAVCGTLLTQMGSVPPLGYLASVPVGALATAILVVNNLRDEATDRVAGKRTLVVRFSRQFGLLEYAGLLLLAQMMPLVLLFSGATGSRSAWLLLPLLTAPLSWKLVNRVILAKGAALNPFLGQTARLLLLYGVLLSLGLLLSGVS